MRKGLVASGVLEYQSFLARLSEAIEQQQSRVDAGYAQFEASRRQWVECHQRSNAVDRVVERYRDEGESGKDLDRPELQRMRRDILRGHVDTVVVHKIDRISRSSGSSA